MLRSTSCSDLRSISPPRYSDLAFVRNGSIAAFFERGFGGDYAKTVGFAVVSPPGAEGAGRANAEELWSNGGRA